MNAGAPTCPQCGGLATNPNAPQCRFCGAQMHASYAGGGYGAPQQQYAAPPGYGGYGAPQQGYAPQNYGPQGYGQPPHNPYGGPAPNPYGGPQPAPYQSHGYVQPFGGYQPAPVVNHGWFGSSGWSTFFWIRLIIVIVAVSISLLGACISAISNG